MLQDKYINPFTDFGFKKLFGEESSKELLIDFLNQLLPQHHQIEDLSYRQTEQLGSTAVDRKAIFDLYCQSPTGERFIVELQKAKQNWFKDRSIFYATFPIQEQAQKGEWDYQLEPVYCIGILDFVFDDNKESSQYLHRVALTEQEHQHLFYDKLWFIYLEMPHFQKTEEQLETHFDRWLYLLKHLPDFDQVPAAFKESIFLKAFEIAEIAQYAPDQKADYERSLKYYRDLKNVTDTAYQEGSEDGFSQGLAKGLEQGLEQGLEEGRKQERIAIARSMQAQNMAVELIEQVTGLKKDEWWRQGD